MVSLGKAGRGEVGPDEVGLRKAGQGLASQGVVRQRSVGQVMAGLGLSPQVCAEHVSVALGSQHTVHENRGPYAFSKRYSTGLRKALRSLSHR